jgi:hypothetical protein
MTIVRDPPLWMKYEDPWMYERQMAQTERLRGHYAAESSISALGIAKSDLSRKHQFEVMMEDNQMWKMPEDQVRRTLTSRSNRWEQEEKSLEDKYLRLSSSDDPFPKRTYSLDFAEGFSETMRRRTNRYY